MKKVENTRPLLGDVLHTLWTKQDPATTKGGFKIISRMKIDFFPETCRNGNLIFFFDEDEISHLFSMVGMLEITTLV